MAPAQGNISNVQHHDEMRMIFMDLTTTAGGNLNSHVMALTQDLPLTRVRFDMI